MNLSIVNLEKVILGTIALGVSLGIESPIATCELYHSSRTETTVFVGKQAKYPKVCHKIGLVQIQGAPC